MRDGDSEKAVEVNQRTQFCRNLLSVKTSGTRLKLLIHQIGDDATPPVISTQLLFVNYNLWWMNSVVFHLPIARCSSFVFSNRKQTKFGINRFVNLVCCPQIN